MADIYTDDAIEDVLENDAISEDAVNAIADLLIELSDDAGNNRVDILDPNAAPPEDTDLLIVTGDVGDVELNPDNLGMTPVIDGSRAGTGINVNLEAEQDADPDALPEQRAIVGSDFDDRVIGGTTDLLVDLGDGNDQVQTGEGDDQVYMGAGDDLVRLGGGGTDVIDGGDGDDTLILSGAETDWSRTENEDGSLTWSNVNTGQTVTTIGVERFEFEPNPLAQGTDTSEDPDPDDL